MQVQLREFEDNKQLLEKQQEIKEFDKSIRLEEEKLGNCSVNELMQQKHSLKKEREIFDKEVILNYTCRCYLLWTHTIFLSCKALQTNVLKHHKSIIVL